MLKYKKREKKFLKIVKQEINCSYEFHTDLEIENTTKKKKKIQKQNKKPWKVYWEIDTEPQSNQPLSHPHNLTYWQDFCAMLPFAILLHHPSATEQQQLKHTNSTITTEKLPDFAH